LRERALATRVPVCALSWRAAGLSKRTQPSGNCVFASVMLAHGPQCLSTSESRVR